MISGIVYCQACFEEMYFRPCTLCGRVFRLTTHYIVEPVCPQCVQADSVLLIEALKRRVYLSNIRQDRINRLTVLDALKQFRLQDGKCFYCNADLSELDFHLEHKHPLSRGGTNTPDNVVFACPPCNFSKNAKTLDEWNPPPP